LLSEAGLSLEDVDELAHGFDYSPYQKIYSLDPMSAKLYGEVFSRESLLRQVERDMSGFPPQRVHHVSHHLAHAASAFFTSGWDDCLVAVVDAMGEAQSVSIFQGHGGGLDKLREISVQDSMGVLYSLVTLHLGFDFNSDEYKIMGLAPYGNPERFRAFFQEAVQLLPDGSIRIPLLRLNLTRDERENYTVTRKYLDDHLARERRPEDEISGEHRDVAAALRNASTE
jgi:carbamoyltransferase